MRRKFIMTVFGQDRVGIVADVTKVMFEHNCNLEDSTMTRLMDEFAIIFLFSSPEKDLEFRLNAACEKLEQEKKLWTFFRPLDSKSPKIPQERKNRHLYISCMEQCGVLYRVSNYLAQKNINIVRLQSSRDFSPDSGQMLYNIDLELELHPDQVFQDLASEMADLEHEFHAEIKLAG